MRLSSGARFAPLRKFGGWRRLLHDRANRGVESNLWRRDAPRKTLLSGLARRLGKRLGWAVSRHGQWTKRVEHIRKRVCAVHARRGYATGEFERRRSDPEVRRQQRLRKSRLHASGAGRGRYGPVGVPSARRQTTDVLWVGRSATESASGGGV